MIKKYKKKPIVIEAAYLSEINFKQITIWCNGTQKGKAIVISTLEGKMSANIGDYIIKGIHGEFYPCKPYIFQKTYDEVK